MSANERNGEYLLSVIEKHDPSLANKVTSYSHIYISGTGLISFDCNQFLQVRRHLEHFKELLRFEMNLRCLMAKVVEHIRNGGDRVCQQSCV